MLTRRQKWKKVMRKITYKPSKFEQNCKCLFCNCININNNDYIEDSELAIPQKKIKFLNKVFVYEYSPCVNDSLWWKEIDYINFRNNNIDSNIYDNKYNTI